MSSKYALCENMLHSSIGPNIAKLSMLDGHNQLYIGVTSKRPEKDILQCMQIRIAQDKQYKKGKKKKYRHPEPDYMYALCTSGSIETIRELEEKTIHFAKQVYGARCKNIDDRALSIPEGREYYILYVRYWQDYNDSYNKMMGELREESVDVRMHEHISHDIECCIIQ